jgi:hypothetical protein
MYSSFSLVHTRLQHSNFVKDLDGSIEGNLGYYFTHARGVCVCVCCVCVCVCVLCVCD